MSWAPPERPYYIPDYYNILAEAVNERADFFASLGKDTGVKVEPLTTPASDLRSHFESLKEALYTLLVNSLDGRQIGGWVEFDPFPDYSDSDNEKFAALLEDYAMPPETWFWSYPCIPGHKGDFFYFCYRLLNDIILYPAITFTASPDAPGSWFGVDSSWEAVNEDNGFHETGKVSVDGLCSRYYPGRQCGYDGGYYLGSYTYGYSKVFSGSLQVLNQSAFKFTGTWQMRFQWVISDSRTYFSHIPPEEQINISETGEWQTLQINGDASEILSPPPEVLSWKDEIRSLPKDAYDGDLAYYGRFAYAAPVFKTGAQLTMENFPALSYKYME